MKTIVFNRGYKAKLDSLVEGYRNETFLFLSDEHKLYTWGNVFYDLGFRAYTQDIQEFLAKENIHNMEFRPDFTLLSVLPPDYNHLGYFMGAFNFDKKKYKKVVEKIYENLKHQLESVELIDL